MVKDIKSINTQVIFFFFLLELFASCFPLWVLCIFPRKDALIVASDAYITTAFLTVPASTITLVHCNIVRSPDCMDWAFFLSHTISIVLLPLFFLVLV